MSDALDRLAEQARTLREDFDRSFRMPLREPSGTLIPFLFVQVAGEKVALALDEVLGLHLDVALVRVPGSPPTLLGLATLRGRIWPTYDLAALLGRAQSGSRRVVALARGKASVAFAFERLESLVRAPAGSILAGTPEAASGEPSIGAVRDEGTLVPLISLARLLDRDLG